MAFSTTGYSNPIGKGLSSERIDMGVDYGGSGPLYALGSGTVTNVYNGGWPGGTFLTIHLDSGSYKGRYIYYAEDINPLVHVGQKVQSGQHIANANGQIEVGWAEPPGTGNTMASQFNQQAQQGDAGSVSTAFGVLMSDLIKGLGGPGGIVQKTVRGTIPADWGVFSQPSTPGSANNPPLTGPNAATVSHTAGGVVGDAQTFLHDSAEFLNFFFAFFHPGQAWRGIMGIGGIVSGAFAISLYTGETVTVKGGRPGFNRSANAGNPSAFPLAVLLTGVAVLALYMAFRPWPVGPSSKPIRPAAYVVEILQGKAPSGDAPANDTDAIEIGLAALLGVWAASKVAGSLGNVAGGIGGIAGALGKLFGKASKDVEAGVEDVGTTAVESGA